jgi:hypothetical protein
MAGAERCGASRVKACLGKKFLGMNAEQSSVHGRRRRLLYAKLLYSIVF